MNSIKNNPKINLYQSDYSYSISSDNFIHPNDINTNFLSNIDCIVNLGAISETNADNPSEILEKNIYFPINLIKNSKKDCKIVFASSASVYGNFSYTKPISEHIDNEKGISKYAQSKLLIDNLIRHFYKDRNYISLRFFNVCSFYNESHKKQPSPTFNFLNQLKKNSNIQLFYNSHEIYRDFIFIDDVVQIINFCINNHIKGIYNVGSNKPVSFEQIADAMIKKIGYGEKIYIQPYDNITNNYQLYTNADLTKLRNAGYLNQIPSILEWIEKYDHR